VSPLVDKALWFAGLGAEALAVALLFNRRIYRIVPVFSLYLLWIIASDVVMMAVSRNYSPLDPNYRQIFMVELSLDSLFQFCVLVELAWAVLRPIRAALPRRTLIVIAVLFLIIGAAMWPIAGRVTLPYHDSQYYTLMRLQQAFSMLRILFVFFLAGFSQLLALGWRDRELQIATGLGFYSLCTLGASILHTHHLSVEIYHIVDQIVAVSFLCSLLYWIFSFAQQEAARQAFTPRMEGFLLAVSGAAQADREKLDEIRRNSKK